MNIESHFVPPDLPRARVQNITSIAATRVSQLSSVCFQLIDNHTILCIDASLHFANITRQYCVSKILKFFPFHDCIKTTRRKYRDVERVLATLMLVFRRTTTRMIADVNASERGNVRAGMRILYYILLVELCSSMLCTISIAAMLLNGYHIIPLLFFCTHIQMQHKLTALL